MVRGLQAESFDGLVLQRIRWTQGMIQIFILKNAWKYGGLSWFQKMSYTSAPFFWFFAFARLMYLTAPHFYILFGLKISQVNTNCVIPHVNTSCFVIELNGTSFPF